ncbi:MAG: hypothetical protein WAN23_07200, partial [Candidatus Acidiferrales bacterium]
GYMYLDSGMAAEAKALIGDAMRDENHVPRVEKCLAEITQRREDEEERERDILRQAVDRREFFLDMGRALSAPAPPIDGQWRFPFGKMVLSVSDGSVNGSAEVKRQEGPIVRALYGLGAEAPVRVDTYVLSGKLTGAVCDFQVIVGEKGEGGIVGLILSNEPSKFGFIVFASDGGSAKYVELSDSKLGKTEIIKRSLSGD